MPQEACCLQWVILWHRCIKIDVAIPGKRISVIKKHIKENCTSLHFFLQGHSK
jgi:hypothetical protein